MTETTIPLHKAKKGETLTIVGTPSGRLMAQLIRLGILAGEQVRCIGVLPGGTIIVQKHRQEIAIGRSLASQIQVRPAPDHAAGKRGRP